jgi:hypothetical protein
MPQDPPNKTRLYESRIKERVFTRTEVKEVLEGALQHIHAYSRGKGENISVNEWFDKTYPDGR